MVTIQIISIYFSPVFDEVLRVPSDSERRKMFLILLLFENLFELYVRSIILDNTLIEKSFHNGLAVKGQKIDVLYLSHSKDFILEKFYFEVNSSKI